ncbi:ABC transporter permease [Cohnella endophytica]|uniref:ABC transporter permease n=1 Tax=Cohnella endophytica TaxID=2419778 RepID=A0A494Y634_9BACL|nr:ABC transporter permease [Cohnella endophytica]RKP55390.1 ABC transporter permease [Cohnella endophytica]
MGNRTVRTVALPVVTLIVFLGLWQTICVGFGIETYTLPTPWNIALSMYEDSALLWKHVLATAYLAIVGLGLGLVVAIVVAIVLHVVPLLREAFSPLLVLSQNVPLIALGPLLMIWFGFGWTPKLILLVLVCFFPIALSILVGLSQAEPQLREYLGMIGASRWERLKRLEFPASLPYLFSGLRIACTYVVSSAIVAEWLGANKGIGYYLKFKSNGFNQPGVFGSIVCVVALSLVFYYAAVIAERLVIRWRPRSQGEWKGASK